MTVLACMQLRRLPRRPYYGWGVFNSSVSLNYANYCSLSRKILLSFSFNTALRVSCLLC